MMIHHHTNFGYRRLSGSGGIMWTDGQTDTDNIPHLNFIKWWGQGWEDYEKKKWNELGRQKMRGKQNCILTYSRL